DGDESPVKHLSNAVRHGILDERLKKQRRYQHGAIHGNLDTDAQPVTESHLFDLEESFRELQLTCKRNAVLGSERETIAKEVTEQHTHAAGRRRIRGRQRAD